MLPYRSAGLDPAERYARLALLRLVAPAAIAVAAIAHPRHAEQQRGIRAIADLGGPVWLPRHLGVSRTGRIGEIAFGPISVELRHHETAGRALHLGGNLAAGLAWRHHDLHPDQ